MQLVLIALTLLFSFFPAAYADQELRCPAQWRVGTHTDANLLESGGSVPAFQGAQAQLNSGEYTLLCMAQGHGQYLPDNLGGQMAKMAVEAVTQQFVAKRSLALVRKEYDEILEESFARVAKFLQREPEATHAGTSLLAALCLNDRIITSNVGNVRAVLARGGMAVALSFDHTPNRPDEHDRIVAAGRQVEVVDKARICGLPVSRSLGDSAVSKYITATPETMVVPLDEHAEFVIIASGIWSVIDNLAAMRLVRSALEQGCTCDQAAQALVEAARYGNNGATGRSRESMSVIVAARSAIRTVATRPDPLYSELTDLMALPADQWLGNSVALHPVVASIMQAQKFIGQTSSQLQTQTPEQAAFSAVFMPRGTSHEVLAQYYSHDRFGLKELQTWASSDVNAINKVLADNDYGISLTEVKDRPAFYVASLLNIAVTWRHKALATKIKVGNALYDAVCMNKYIATFNDADHPHPIFAVYTKSKDIVLLTKAVRHCSNIELLGTVTKMQRDMKLSAEPYEELVFPMVDFSDTGDVTWLEGMQLDHVWYLHQIVQQTKLTMNQYGARASSAGAMSVVARGVSFKKVRSYTINEPFLCWIMRPGMRQPLFASYISPDQWKDPGTAADEIADEAEAMPEYHTQEQ